MGASDIKYSSFNMGCYTRNPENSTVEENSP
jgi:hypothetical protein